MVTVTAASGFELDPEVVPDSRHRGTDAQMTDAGENQRPAIRITMLKAINLHKSFGKREVVRGVTMQVEPGKVVGLLGPNGAGKTTCFYMIVGLIPVDQGQILVDETDVTHEPVNVRSGLGVGYLPQDASIFRKLSRPDNIMAILEIRQEPGRVRTQEITCTS